MKNWIGLSNMAACIFGDFAFRDAPFRRLADVDTGGRNVVANKEAVSKGTPFTAKGNKILILSF
jgi:hypothetical protein